MLRSKTYPWITIKITHTPDEALFKCEECRGTMKITNISKVTKEYMQEVTSRFETKHHHYKNAQPESVPVTINEVNKEELILEALNKIELILTETVADYNSDLMLELRWALKQLKELK